MLLGVGILVDVDPEHELLLLVIQRLGIPVRGGDRHGLPRLGHPVRLLQIDLDCELAVLRDLVAHVLTNRLLCHDQCLLFLGFDLRTPRPRRSILTRRCFAAIALLSYVLNKPSSQQRGLIPRARSGAKRIRLQIAHLTSPSVAAATARTTSTVFSTSARMTATWSSETRPGGR